MTKSQLFQRKAYFDAKSLPIVAILNMFQAILKTFSAFRQGLLAVGSRSVHVFFLENSKSSKKLREQSVQFTYLGTENLPRSSEALLLDRFEFGVDQRRGEMELSPTFSFT
jgi:hypothetical protein